MRKHEFSPEQMERLRANPYTQFVSAKTIRYTPTFTSEFRDRYEAGDDPFDIFKELGYDPEVLGDSRIRGYVAKFTKAEREWNNLSSAERNMQILRRLERLETEVEQLKDAILLQVQRDKTYEK